MTAPNTSVPRGRAQMLRITMELEGELIVDRLLAGIADRAGDLTPAWPGVVQVFRGIAQRAFDSEGASTGAPWPELAESTQQERARLGYGPQHPILQRTGALMRSLTLGAGGSTLMTPGRLEIGGIDYLKYHQSNQPRKKLPRRAPINLTMDDRHEIMRPIRLYLTGRDVGGFQRGRVA